MKRITQRQFDIPAEVSGRRVTNRGVHLQPFGFHGMWMERELEEQYWTELMKSMGISWVVMLTEGDSVLEDIKGTTPLKVLLDAGIIPIIRDRRKFPRGFVNFKTVERTVPLYKEYGLRPFWQLWNEPFDGREWRDADVPEYDEAWEIVARRWSEGAAAVARAGAYVGFPDGPCYRENPFTRIRKAGGIEWFEKGVAFYAPHTYGKNRPLWYPYDAVTRHGAQLTDDAYKRLLDIFAEEKNWYDAPLEFLNEQRRNWADPTRTAIDDDTCWLGWEKIVMWAVDELGFVPPFAMTEGGWAPRDRAGSDPVDARWPYTTPEMVAKKTLQMYDSPSPFFAICPWLIASEDMGGTGWFDDAWHGGAFNREYGETLGRKKPVIITLEETPPKEIAPRAEPMVIGVDADTRDMAWVREAYGADYRRGTTTMRLIQVLEYAVTDTLDVVVVDSNGLYVEGAEFYYHHPDAPPIDGDEWYGRGELKATGKDGRIAFKVKGAPCEAGSCQGAIWPKGKGDVLEGLGLLAGTDNYHLNGVWQLVEEGTPIPEEPEEEPEEKEPEKPEEKPEEKEPEKPKPKPIELQIDARIASLLKLDLSGDEYRLKTIVWMDPNESDGLHHIFLDVVDGEGNRLAGERVRVFWADGREDVTIEEKPGEAWGGNFPMFATMGAYGAQAVAETGSSDKVEGMGMGTPQEPEVRHHTSFGLRFVRGPVQESPPTDEETEPEEKPDEPETEPEEDTKPETPIEPVEAKVDPRIASFLTLDRGGDAYKLEEVIWMDDDESKGLHHIFIDIVDSAGERLVGEKIRVWWSDGETIVTTEEKAGEPWSGNFQMFTTLGSYSAEVVAESGTSDKVKGMGMGTPEHPKVKYHTSFGLKFRAVRK